LLAFEQTGPDTFRAPLLADSLPRLFGGQLAAQALAAAGATVGGMRPPHSLHSYFLRIGRPDLPITYSVERIRDGRSFSNRHVVASQDGNAIFTMAASFHSGERGLDHRAPMPQASAPYVLPTMAEAFGFGGNGSRIFDFIDVRVAQGAFDYKRKSAADEHRQLWFRATAPLPDDPLFHTCLVAFASDLMPSVTILSHHGISPRDMAQTASIDHAVWFHRPVLADRWLCYDQVSPTAFGGRGMFMGRVFTEEGILVASVVQEVLLRMNDPDMVS
jgi:acyl-CoA thioesterase-2